MPPRQQPPLKGGQHFFQNADMEIDQLATALFSPTLGTKAFFDESENLMSLDTPIIVFLDGIIETESHSFVRSHRRMTVPPCDQ